MKWFHGESLVPIAGRPLQARLCHLEVWGGSAEREASSRRAVRMGAFVAPGTDAPAKKKGVRQANWCQCSRCKSGGKEKESHHFHPESWAPVREGGG